MTDDLVKRLRDVFADTPEILSWIDTSTYEGAEIRTHVAGMFEAMLLADDYIERLEASLVRTFEHMMEDGRRVEKLEAALRFIAGPSTVEFVDGTYEISETKMLSTYRRRAKRALEGNYDD